MRNGLTPGDTVLVPQHFKPRGTDRGYDRGTLTEITFAAGGYWARIKTDDGRDIRTAIGLVRKAT